jgi:predicted Zn-dependent protease
MERARSYCKRLLAVNPTVAFYYLLWAEVLASSRQWAQASEACHKALGLEPTLIPARQVLITSYLRMGRRTLAQSQLELLMALEPLEPEKLRLWYEGQMKPDKE